MSSGTGPPSRRRNTRRAPKAVNSVVLAILRSPLHSLLDSGICELTYQGRRSGRGIALPVMYARFGDGFAVVAGDAPGKRWWRNFTAPRPVRVRRGGHLRAGSCRVLAPDDPSFGPAMRAYTRRHHHASPGATDRLLLIEFT